MATAATLKKRIKSLLENRTDTYLLSTVHDLLAAETSTRELKDRMEAGVLAGEADIAARRSMSLAVFEKRIKVSLREKIAAHRSGKG